jgi:ubiquinone/menaquinone biosynthesis C-methylase UbiE
MDAWMYYMIVIGIIILCCLIFGLPRKHSQHMPSIEGIDDPAVAVVFEWVTNFYPARMLRKGLIRRLKKLASRGTLVDVGCGSGKLIIDIAAAFPDKGSLELIGVNIAEEMTQIAQANANTQRFGYRVSFKVGAGAQLPFPDDSIDVVVSTLSLHHWDDPVTVIEEVYRVLKPGGQLILFDFRRDARKAFYGLFTFATHVVVPTALKRAKEPLGSIRAAYALAEGKELFAQTSFKTAAADAMLAFMFLTGQK